MDGDEAEKLRITVSVGVAELSGEDRTELVENADKALYRVKELGRNCVVVWDDNDAESENSCFGRNTD